jgi:hypothetical protein
MFVFYTPVKSWRIIGVALIFIGAGVGLAANLLALSA